MRCSAGSDPVKALKSLTDIATNKSEEAVTKM
jgi:hypothetical protein